MKTVLYLFAFVLTLIVASCSSRPKSPEATDTPLIKEDTAVDRTKVYQPSPPPVDTLVGADTPTAP